MKQWTKEGELLNGRLAFISYFLVVIIESHFAAFLFVSHSWWLRRENVKNVLVGQAQNESSWGGNGSRYHLPFVCHYLRCLIMKMRQARAPVKVSNGQLLIWHSAESKWDDCHLLFLSANRKVLSWIAIGASIEFLRYFAVHFLPFGGEREVNIFKLDVENYPPVKFL